MLETDTMLGRGAFEPHQWDRREGTTRWPGQHQHLELGDTEDFQDRKVGSA